VFRKWLRALFAPFLFAACTGSGIALPSQAPAPIYALDLSGQIDGVAWDGLSIGSSAPTHDITIVSKTDVNEFRVISCHRFLKFEDVIQTGWFRPNRGYEFTLSLAPGIEDTGQCPIRLQAYSKQLDKDGNPVGSAFGILIFKNSHYTLPAENICNGADGGSTGTSVCQSMAGLVERVKFSEQVIAANPANIPDGMPKPCQGKFIDAETFEYVMPTGECAIEFASTKAPHRFALHFAYGFNKIFYRGSE